MYEKEFEMLLDYAKYLGFRIVRIPTGKSIINHRCKYIEVSFEHGQLNALYSLAHELGHVQQFNEGKYVDYSNWGERHVYMSKIRNNRYKLVLYEFDAWVKGYKLLKELGIGTRGFLKKSSISLYTYIMRTKRKDLRRKEGCMLTLETMIRLLIIKYKLHRELKSST